MHPGRRLLAPSGSTSPPWDCRSRPELPGAPRGGTGAGDSGTAKTQAFLRRQGWGEGGSRVAPRDPRGRRSALELRATGCELLTCEFTLSAVVEVLLVLSLVLCGAHRVPAKCSAWAVQSTVRQVMNRHDAGAAGHARVGRQVMARGAAAHPMRGHHVRLGRHSCTHSCWLLLSSCHLTRARRRVSKG